MVFAIFLRPVSAVFACVGVVRPAIIWSLFHSYYPKITFWPSRRWHCAVCKVCSTVSRYTLPSRSVAYRGVVWGGGSNPPPPEIPRFCQSWAEFPVPWNIHQNTGFIHLQIEWNPWLGGYRPPDPRSLCPLSLMNLLNFPPPQEKIPGYASVHGARWSWQQHAPLLYRSSLKDKTVRCHAPQDCHEASQSSDADLPWVSLRGATLSCGDFHCLSVSVGQAMWNRYEVCP
jgi:hypothetical protein